MKILRYTFKDRSQSRTTTLILNEIKKKENHTAYPPTWKKQLHTDQR